MRVMLAPVGSRGDVQPVAALSRRLLDEGHDVLFCAAANFASLAESAGLPYRLGGRDVQAAVEEEGEGVFNPMGFIRVAQRVMREQHDLILEAALDFKPDLLLATPLLFTAPSLAELTGARLAWVSLFPSMLPSPSYPFPLLGWSARRPWLNSLSWTVGGWITEMLFKEARRLRQERGLAPVGEVYAFFVASGPLLLGMDPEVLAGPPRWAAHSRETGFWFLDVDAPLPEEVEAFLAAGPPPVYVGFGSMPVKDKAARTREIVEAIEASGQRGLISAGWGELGDGALPESILRVSSISHRRLFPRVAAVAHHCGAGTTATALRAGVPQVPVPHGFDQPLWAERVHALGVATPPLGRRFRPADLGAALKRAAEDASLRAAAAHHGARIAAQDGCGQAVALLEAYLAGGQLP